MQYIACYLSDSNVFLQLLYFEASLLACECTAMHAGAFASIALIASEGSSDGQKLQLQLAIQVSIRLMWGMTQDVLKVEAA